MQDVGVPLVELRQQGVDLAPGEAARSFASADSSVGTGRVRNGRPQSGGAKMGRQSACRGASPDGDMQLRANQKIDGPVSVV